MAAFPPLFQRTNDCFGSAFIHAKCRRIGKTTARRSHRPQVPDPNRIRWEDSCSELRRATVVPVEGSPKPLPQVPR